MVFSEGSNMKAPLISVIIPVYNVERFLSKCLKSVLRQTYRNIEVILVDDGSLDRSRDICQVYSKKDKRVRVLTQKNKGVSVARNNGLDKARGEYCCFIDSDDWVTDDYVECLYEDIIDNKSDLTVGGQVALGMLRSIKMPVQKRTLKTKTEEFAHYLYIEKNQMAGPCCKLFKMSIINTNGLRFNPTMRCGQDADFVFRYIAYCSRISVFPDYIYFYNRLNEYSSTKKFWAEKHKWIMIIMRDQLDLFTNCMNDAIESMSINYCILWFNRLIEEAVKFYSDSRSLTERIHTISNEFRPFIKNELINEQLCNLNWLEKYKYYSSFIDSKRTESLSSLLLEGKKDGQEPWIKKTLRRVLVKCKLFCVFKIGI